MATLLVLRWPSQRLVLAMLLVGRGATVSTDALIDGLWEESPPPTARKTLQGYVHHLRSKIGEVLQTDKSGYSLHVPDTLVDERRFGATVADARQLLEIDPATASEQLSGHWRYGGETRMPTSTVRRSCGPRSPGSPSRGR